VPLSSSRRPASRVTPLPVVEAITELVCSLVSPLPHLLREPLCCAEHSVVVLLPLVPPSSLRAGRRNSPCSSPPLHVGSTALMLEAKPCHHSLVAWPPELHHCRPSSGEQRATAAVVPSTPTTRPYPVYSPRADRHREHRRGHPCRRVATAFSRPNWHLLEDRAHTSHLPDRSTRFLRRLSSRTPVSTPSPTAPPRTGSPGEPHLPEMPQSSSPRSRVALAVVPDPPCRWLASKSGRPPSPLLQAPTLPCLRVGHARCYASGPRQHSASGMCRYCASGPHARFSPLALICFPEFSDLIQNLQISKICT
jgi:hypothetical protein